MSSRKEEKMDCKYCHKLLNGQLFYAEDLEVSMLWDTVTVDVYCCGMYPKSFKINFCPMCGRDLRGGKK